MKRSDKNNLDNSISIHSKSHDRSSHSSEYSNDKSIDKHSLTSSTDSLYDIKTKSKSYHGSLNNTVNGGTNVNTLIKKNTDDLINTKQTTSTDKSEKSENSKNRKKYPYRKYNINYVPNLKKYLQVHFSDVDKLEERSYILYKRKKDGKWIRGGYLRFITNKNDVKRLQLENFPDDRKSPKYFSWGVKISEIEELYKGMITNNINTLITLVKSQQREIVQMKIRIDVLERGLIGIVNNKKGGNELFTSSQLYGNSQTTNSSSQQTTNSSSQQITNNSPQQINNNSLQSQTTNKTLSLLPVLNNSILSSMNNINQNNILQQSKQMDIQPTMNVFPLNSPPNKLLNNNQLMLSTESISRSMRSTNQTPLSTPQPTPRQSPVSTQLPTPRQTPLSTPLPTPRQTPLSTPQHSPTKSRHYLSPFGNNKNSNQRNKK